MCPLDPSPIFNSMIFATSSLRLSSLSLPVTDMEIIGALKCLKPRKAPGPDGLHAIFFRKYWDIVGSSIKGFVRNIFEGGSLPKGANYTLISLIPKCPCPEIISQFQPISLCNTSYKIITKILVRRLRPFLDDFISPIQSRFIPGCRVADNVVLLKEAHTSHKNKRGGKGIMILKLDLEKAFDRLERSFIHNIFKLFQLLDNFIRVTMLCIFSTRTRVLFQWRPT
ncbi:hypothetical protein CDL15_Pgr010340 [Punica granatum]|uniref:Reverse transcriptase domain-containing protein n=1 Tax=Punica granatum TaxID=22663 RepID=A0A218W2E1_PUNGR|nr:hypothetical protein CDL15_Pgr010340 [Punica granatum]